jgi:phage protein U
MLYALGPLTFEIAPVNAQEINRVTEASYVEKSVIGRRPPL